MPRLAAVESMGCAHCPPRGRPRCSVRCTVPRSLRGSRHRSRGHGRDGRLGRQRQTRPAFPGYPGKRHGLPARTGTRAAPPSQGGRCAGAGSNGEDGPSFESTTYTVAREIFRARKMPRRAEPQRHHHQCHHRALGPEPGRTVPPLSEPGRDRAGGGVLGGRAPDGAGDTAIIPSGPPSASRTVPGGTVSRPGTRVRRGRASAPRRTPPGRRTRSPRCAIRAPRCAAVRR